MSAARFGGWWQENITFAIFLNCKIEFTINEMKYVISLIIFTSKVSDSESYLHSYGNYGVKKLVSACAIARKKREENDKGALSEWKP